ncbi:enoyl-CoA hydratase [Actinoplanes lobatus]|uniref:Enoyl-CoA hydratase n=1 Tax=Actinoplanes lobatus TaxID=113568 RepID=A0A7W7HRA2_9ACTN|nr:enoyl-CoA hydratase-related protein [Actinoplanes lobatus]MBB4755200.1 enoyl-CoA hydratase/carnithine racemase [Actinoplanes lobatus]GGN88907.1 enoyl-CoA hydratase [Actinoplanes lobatus]GIE43406.1 enoyl-CoA hydratase [Actinoplanes lobatus]
MPTLDRHDDVYVLDLGDTENRLHPDMLTALNKLLDEIEADTRNAPRPVALVTTASGRHYSLGLDLDWLAGHPQERLAYAISVHDLLARILTLPMVTVAAMPGHVFAGGAMLSLAHDLRVMRADRGFWCLPEADINLPFTPGMSALIQARLTPQTAHEAMVTARRYGGLDAAELRIIDQAVPADDVLPTAVSLAASLASKAGPALGTIKTRLYPDVLQALRSPQL